MPIFRILTLAMLLLFAAVMFNACPANTDDPDDADQYGEQGHATDAPAGADVEAPAGGGGPPVSTRGGAESEPPAGEGEDGTQGSTYIMKQAEIMAVDVESGLIDVQIIEGDTATPQTFTLADGFPKCPDCGMEMTIQKGDKGEFDFTTAQDGTLKFVGYHCEDRAKCAAGDKSACENCPAHQKKEAPAEAA